MKKSLITCIIIALSCIVSQSSAQVLPVYTLTIKNISYKATALEFDVYLLHTNSSTTNFEYAAGQYFIFFNTAILNGGTGKYSIVSSQLPLNMQPRNASVAGNVLRLATNVPPGAGLGFTIPSRSPGILIAKMRLTNTAGTLNTALNPDLKWKNIGTAPVTSINAYVGVVNSKITTPATHLVESTILKAGDDVTFTSIESADDGANDDVSIYPNPSNGAFTIDLSNQNVKNVHIYDAMGKLVYNKVNTTENLLNIDLENKSQGIYFLNVISNNKVLSKKIMVK